MGAHLMVSFWILLDYHNGRLNSSILLWKFVKIWVDRLFSLNMNKYSMVLAETHHRSDLHQRYSHVCFVDKAHTSLKNRKFKDLIK